MWWQQTSGIWIRGPIRVHPKIRGKFCLSPRLRVSAVNRVFRSRAIPGPPDRAGFARLGWDLGDFLELAANHLVDQQKIQADDDACDQIRHIVGARAVHQVGHHGLGAGQQDQGNQGKWNREAKHNL